MAKRNRPLAFGCPDSSDDRLQADAVLVRGPDLNRFVRVLGPLLCNNGGQLFSKAALSSGVAEAGWRGRGFCTDQQSPSAPPSRAAAPPGSAPARQPSRRPPLGWSTAPIGRGLTQAVL